MSLQAIRGATTVKKNTAEDITLATKELLEKIVSINKIKEKDIISIIFSATSDLDAVYPAAAARELGWNNLALLCTQEMKVKNMLKKCIRVLMLVNANTKKLQHIYLKDAKKLRPDLIS